MGGTTVVHSVFDMCTECHHSQWLGMFVESLYHLRESGVCCCDLNADLNEAAGCGDGRGSLVARQGAGGREGLARSRECVPFCYILSM